MKNLIRTLRKKRSDRIILFRAQKRFSKSMQRFQNYYRSRWVVFDKENQMQSVLTPEQKKQIDSLWKDRYPIGKDYTYQFHEFYTRATGVFDPHYIPDDIYLRIVDPFFNNRKRAEQIDHKCLYQILFPSVLHPETIGFRVSGTWMDMTNHPITEKDLAGKLQYEHEAVIKRATSSMGGKGVYFLSGDDLTDQVFRTVNAISGDVVIQKTLHQHTELGRLNPTSINTVRHISFLKDGHATVYSSILRMGINGSRVDNASSGGITCGITENGRLKPVAYATSGQRFETHPSSGIAFDTIVVPSFRQSLEMVKKLHESFPMFRLVSWDIAINEEGIPVLIEPNLYVGELDFHQLNNGPLFGKDQDMILKEVKWAIPESFF